MSYVLSGGGATGGATGRAYVTYADANTYLIAPGSTGSITSLTFAGNSLFIWPILVPAVRTFTAAAFYVASFTTASNCRIGLYGVDAPTGTPTTVLWDSGNIPVAATGLKTAVIPSVVLNAGQYYQALWTGTGVAAVSAIGTLTSTVNQATFSAGAAPALAHGFLFIKTFSTSTPLPDLTGDASWSNLMPTTNIPVIGIK